MKKRTLLRVIWIALASVFFIWNWNTFQSSDLPKNTFETDSLVTVEETEQKYIFRALNPQSPYEVIFLQGGFVDPKAYAPLCRKMASYGFTTHLLKMPFRMPVWNPKLVLDSFDFESTKFVLGGHSQGGKVASNLVYENPKLFHGLFLLGTSHPRDIDMSRISVPTLKLYAEFDGLASSEEVYENVDKLPFDYELLQIRGGNHSQFGYLGTLLMDDKADISIKEQQHYTFAFLVKYLNRLKDCYQ